MKFNEYSRLQNLEAEAQEKEDKSYGYVFSDCEFADGTCEHEDSDCTCSLDDLSTCEYAIKLAGK